MYFSLSLLGALLMGASTVSAVDATGYMNSGNCGQTDPDPQFPWGKMTDQCYTFDFDGPQIINSVHFDNVDNSDCPGNLTSFIFTYSDFGCTEFRTHFGPLMGPDCLPGGDDGFRGFQHMCCTDLGPSPNNCISFA